MRRLLRPKGDKSSKDKPKLAIVKPPSNPLREEIDELTLQQQVLSLKTEGLSHGQIAKELGITPHRVTEALVTSLDEYYAERDGAVQRYLAIAQARYDRILRTWMPRAEERVEIVKDADGTEMEVVHAPDPEAARVVLTAMRDLAKIMGLNKIRVEHTGKDGGTIDFNVDLNMMTDEQLRKFIETGDAGVLRSFASAIAGASGPGTPASTGTTD